MSAEPDPHGDLVLDEHRSLAFCRALGFEERGRRRVGGDSATVIFLGLPGDGARLELTLNDGPCTGHC